MSCIWQSHQLHKLLQEGTHISATLQGPTSHSNLSCSLRAFTPKQNPHCLKLQALAPYVQLMGLLAPKLPCIGARLPQAAAMAEEPPSLSYLQVPAPQAQPAAAQQVPRSQKQPPPPLSQPVVGRPAQQTQPPQPLPRPQGQPPPPLTQQVRRGPAQAQGKLAELQGVHQYPSRHKVDADSSDMGQYAMP